MPAVRSAAVQAVRSFVTNANPWSTALLLPALLHQIKTAGKWHVKIGALTILDELVTSAPQQTAKLMPAIVPVLSEAILGHEGRCQETRPRVAHKGHRSGFQQGYRTVYSRPYSIID